MSKIVDERVVEMRFDNKDFENNVKTSMSTLDKLKNALKLPDLKSKGNLSALNNSIKTATGNMNGLNNAVKTVRASFSALDVVGVTALANITNGVLNSAKNMVNAFTLAPITSGFREYETQMNAVQTILANTASKGTTINDVTAALDELNEYADMTIYNFTEMTKNIGTFTAAGVDLDKAVAAIKGIANLGAMSGSTSAQVNTAMYQLSQALATGKVSLMDWNSVVNAGMGGEQFQTALKRTAEHFGSDVDAMIKKYGSFRESLTEGGWLTAEVLTETLNQISGAYTEADLIQQGYTESQAKAITQMATTATDAATKVKTFTQLMDTLQEAAGSGWAKTWQIVLGDFEEAKEFFTSLSDYFSEIIGGMSDARNNMLAGAFDSNFKKLTSAVEEAGVPLDTFTDKLKQVAKETYNIDLDAKIAEFGSLEKAMQNIPQAGNMIIDTIKALAGAGTEMNNSTEAMTDKLEYFQKVVDEVWQGKWKNAPERFQMLAEAGYDYVKVQDLVNKTVDGHRLTLDDLSESQMKAIGYTDDEITKLKELAKQAETSGTSINELIENLDKPSGRQLFLKSITNSLKAIAEPLKAVGQAFGQVFAIDPSNMYKAIEALHGFTSALVIDEDTYNNIVRISRGIFGIFNIFTTFGTGVFGIAFKTLTAVLENFNLGIMDVLAFLGDLIYMFSDFVTSGEPVIAFFENIKNAITGSSGPIATFINKFKEITSVSEPIKTVIGMIEKLWNVLLMFSRTSAAEGPAKAFELLSSYLRSISWDEVLSNLSQIGPAIVDAFNAAVAAAEEVGPDIIAGLQNGLSDGVGKILSIMREIGTKIIEAIKAVLGIQSPSTVMFEIGQNIVQGLINGVNSLVDGLFDILSNIGEHIAELLKDVDWGTVFTALFAIGSLATAWKAINVLESFAAPFEAFGKMFDNVAGVVGSAKGVLDSLSGTLKAYQMQIKANAIKDIAVAIAILAGSIVVLCQMDVAKVWSSVGALTVLGAVLVGLAAALNKFSSMTAKSNKGSLKDTAKQLLDVGKIAALLVSVGASLLMLAGAMRLLGSMNEAEVKQAGIIIAAFGGLIATLTLVSKFAGDGEQVKQVGKIASRLATSFLILSVSMRLLGTMDPGVMKQALEVIVAFGLIVTMMTVAAQSAGKKAGQIGSMALKFSIALGLLAMALRSLGSIEAGQLEQAMQVVTAFGLVITLLTVVSGAAGKSLDRVASTMLSFSAAIGILAIAMKLISSMSFEDLSKAAVGIATLAFIISTMVAVLTKNTDEEELLKAGATMLAMSFAVAILAGVSVLLGMVDTANLVKGIAAVAALTLLVSMMAIAARGVNEAKGTMIGLAVVVGVLAASLAILSFLDPKSLIAPTAAMSAVMGMFALILKMGSNIQTSLGVIITMTAAIGLIAAALAILAQFDPMSVLSSAAALSVVLVTIVAVFQSIDSVGKIATNTLVAMATITGVVAAIGAILVVMSAMDVQSAIPNAMALSLLLGTITAALTVLDGVGTVSTNSMVAMLALTGILALLSGVLGLMSAMNIQSSIQDAIALSTLLLAMSAATAILSAIGPVASGAIAAAGSMAGVIAIIAGIVAAAGAIKQIPGADWLISEGASFLQKIGEAIGGFIGGIAGGVLEGATSSLGSVADNLSDFMTRLSPFIEGVKSIDPSIQTSIGTLSGAILSLTGAGLLESITSFITGGSSLSAFAEQLVPFGQAMMEYSNAVSGIDAEAVTASANAAKALGELANNLPKEGGLAQAIFGETGDFASFGTQLVLFGTGLKAYSSAVTGIDVAAIQGSAEAGKALSDLASSLPKEGGLAQAIFGENVDMGIFGTQLLLFGLGLKNYANNVSGMDVEAIQASVPAGQALANLAKSIGEMKNGGILSLFTGESTNMATFGENLAAFGDALASYADSVSGLSFDKITNATNAVGVIINMIKNNSDADFSGGIENIKKISGVGTAIKTYSDNVSEFNSGKVNESVNSINSLIGIITRMVGLDITGVSKFKQAIEELSSLNIEGLVNAFNGASSEMLAAGANLMSWLANGIQEGSGRVTVAAQKVLIDLATMIGNAARAFDVGGIAIVRYLAQGISESSGLPRAAITVVLTIAASSIRSYYGSFYSAGAYLCQGLAAGITANSYMVRARASAMASAAATAARSALDINSPSKVFRKIGRSIPEGFIQGIGLLGTSVTEAAKTMSTDAIETTRKTIERISSWFDSDIDMNPVITPVVDLDNVSDGVASINSMLNRTQPISLMANVSAINRMMGQRNQNGELSEVVSAISGLQDKLDNIGRPSYNVGGITYDDGSAVAGAVETLIRATKIERRS